MINFKFREGSSDKNIFTDVFHRNEYNVPSLDPNSIVIDIGSHIGSFTAKAYASGSRHIYAYEADKENYDMGKSALSALNGVNQFHFAVVGVNEENKEFVAHTGYTTMEDGELNTGGGNVLFATETEDKSNLVPVKHIDSIYEEAASNDRYVSILKLDCEGSEWNILFGAKVDNLRRTRYICMEFHEYDYYNVKDLSAYLMSLGFHVQYVVTNNSPIGKLFAYNVSI